MGLQWLQVARIRVSIVGISSDQRYRLFGLLAGSRHEEGIDGQRSPRGVQ
jgi:hypothetical protein